MVHRFVCFRHFLLAFLLCAHASADVLKEEVKPPFGGLQWGESEDRLETLLNGAKAKIVERRVVDGRDAWTVEGLIQAYLQRTVFYFKADQLVEVELQYQSPDWDTTKYENLMSETRQRIEQKYGAGQLIARSTTVQGDVTQTVVGYKWSQNGSAIELIYFSAQNAASQTYRTLSLHYKSY